MKVPVSWLREYVEVSATTQDMADRLAIATGEVERITRRGIADENGNYGHFKVGRVLEAGKHPNADRLQLCRVDVGEPEPRQIVCGAWNFGAGATVAVALPGAVLPDGNRLEQAKLRGEVSDGMILSEQRARARHGPRGHTRPLRPVRARHAARGCPPARRGGPGDRDDAQPARLSVGLRHRQGGRGALLRRAEAAAGSRSRPRGCGDTGHHDRGLRGLPALHRPALPQRRHRRLAALAEGADHRGRDAPHLECRRRDELRHARPRKPSPRLRFRHAARRGRSSCVGRRRARSSRPSTAPCAR